jgi:hypothetical protein
MTSRTKLSIGRRRPIGVGVGVAIGIEIRRVCGGLSGGRLDSDSDTDTDTYGDYRAFGPGAPS